MLEALVAKTCCEDLCMTTLATTRPRRLIDEQDFDSFANAINFAFEGRKLNFDFRSTCYRCRRNTVPHKRLWRIRHSCEGEGRVLTPVASDWLKKDRPAQCAGLGIAAEEVCTDR